jgi:hypothetical protein
VIQRETKRDQAISVWCGYKKKILIIQQCNIHVKRRQGKHSAEKKSNFCVKKVEIPNDRILFVCII